MYASLTVAVLWLALCVLASRGTDPVALDRRRALRVATMALALFYVVAGLAITFTDLGPDPEPQIIKVTVTESGERV